MQEVYRYDFETKQRILHELEEESNASLEDYEDPPCNATVRRSSTMCTERSGQG